MRRKILLVSSAIAVIGLAVYSLQPRGEEMILSEMAMENVEALAYRVNPDCPNGCLTTEGSCKCYGEHPYREAEW